MRLVAQTLETSYMYQLFARMYGTDNLPDSSNMCHESTSVGPKEAIGVGVGTVRLEDFEKTDLMFFFGQNVGTNSPRMLHPLQEARKRGVPIITFNPLREPGLLKFSNPQSPVEMMTPAHTLISTQYHQVKTGGDTAALLGICKIVIDADDRARERGAPRVLDVDFIETNTVGFEAFANYVRAASWSEIERVSGLPRADLEAAAAEYMRANAVTAHYGMGITQHRQGVQNARMLCHLLFLRGNVGKPGAGPSPVRGHSNVQGQYRDETQSQSSRAWREVVHSAVPEPHRNRYAGKRRAGGIDGRQHRLHSRFARRGRARFAGCALGAAYRRGTGEAHARRALDGGLGSLAQRLRAGARRDCENLSRHLPRFQRKNVDARRLPAQSGRA